MKTITLLFLGLSLTLIGYSQVSKTVYVATAGGLLSALTATELTTVTNLTVTGNIDAQDFKTMRSKITKLAVLDISGVNIIAYTGILGTAGTSNTEYPANAIPESSFRSKKSLTSVTLPASIISIGREAFDSCEGLLSISLPASLTSIGSFSFASCTSLTSLYIPSSVVDIRGFAFNYSKISIIVDSNNPNYSGIDGILFNKTQTILLYCPTTRTGIYDIPQSVTAIEYYAFDGCIGLTSVTIPSSVTSIGIGAFYICSALTTVNFLQPSSITAIGNSAFYKCKSLVSICIPASVLSIGINAFAEIGGQITIDPNNLNYSSIDGILFNKTLTTLIQCPVSKTGDYIMPQSVTKIEKNAFYACGGLTSVVIPSSVNVIGASAFNKCTGLTSIVIPDVDTIQSYTFNGCSGLTSVTLPPSVNAIGASAFQGCSGLTAIIIPPTVSSIENYVFEGCSSLATVTIPSSVTSIGEYAFCYCSSLTTVTIPSSVITIKSDAFSGCSGLTSIYANATIPVSINTWVFYNVNKTTCTLYVPVGSKNAYQSADEWKDFLNIVEISTGLPTQIIPAISLFPNPFKEGFWINGIEGFAKITIIDLYGKIQFMKQGVGNEYISVTALPKGVFIVKINTANGIMEKKMIKQ